MATRERAGRGVVAMAASRRGQVGVAPPAKRSHEGEEQRAPAGVRAYPPVDFPLTRAREGHSIIMVIDLVLRDILSRCKLYTKHAWRRMLMHIAAKRLRGTAI